MIKAAGAEVVLCTNGIPLNRPDVTRRIIDIGVDAVSISLDSPDPAENDRYRPARNNRHGHADVIAGAQALLAARAGRTRPRVGFYSVITRRTIAAMPAMAELAAALGADYFVPQPVSLPPDHPLYRELALRRGHASQVAASLDQLYAAALPVSLPDPSYAASFTATVQDDSPGLVAGCFGGHTLFFIEPDGSVWDCPSVAQDRSHASTTAAQHPRRRRQAPVRLRPAGLPGGLRAVLRRLRQHVAAHGLRHVRATRGASPMNETSPAARQLADGRDRPGTRGHARAGRRRAG